MQTTIFAKPLWLTIRLRRRSMIPNAMASAAAALAFMSIGTMEQRRSTREILEKRMESNCFKSADYRTRESLGRMPNETFARGEVGSLIIESVGLRERERFD